MEEVNRAWGTLVGEKIKQRKYEGPSDPISPSALHPKMVHKFTAQMGEVIDEFTR